MPDSTLSPRVAVYTGTFDPVHHGHLDIIERGSRLYDRLIVGVGINPDKKTLFTIDERVQLIRDVCRRVGERGGAVVRRAWRCGSFASAGRGSCSAGCARSPTWSTSSPCR